MSLEQHSIFKLAAVQLQTAIALFIYGEEKFSVITLAGAADVLLSQLVKNQNKEAFLETLQKEEIDVSEKDLPLGKYARKIHDMLFVNAMKHLDADEDRYVTMDVDSCALTAVLKALPNFCLLGGRDWECVKDLKRWMKENLDPKIYNVDCIPNWKPETEPKEAG